jgi:transposase-like protein
MIRQKSKQCRKCYITTHINENKPDLISLLSDVKMLGYSATERKYNVSDNTIRKWVKKC